MSMKLSIRDSRFSIRDSRMANIIARGHLMAIKHILGIKQFPKIRIRPSDYDEPQCGVEIKPTIFLTANEFDLTKAANSVIKSYH